MASKENIYFLRSFLLFIEGGLYISKEILSRECQKPDTYLDELLQKYKQKLKHSFHVNQYQKLYPEFGKADIKNWDLQLSVGVLINVFGRDLKSGEKVKLKLLRDLRNDIYMHCTTAALDESKYEDIIEDLGDIITTLASTFDISVQQRCSNCIKQFTSGPLDAVKPSLQTLNGFSQSCQKKVKVGVQTELVICGPSTNWITLCEQTLETIFNHAESMASENGGFQEIQKNVNRMLSYLESNKAAVFKGCERKCIILFFECKDYENFLNFLHKVECQEYTSYLRDLSNSLHSFFKPRNPISITSKVTSECLQSVLIDNIKTSSNEKEEQRHIVQISSEGNIHDNKPMAPRDVNTDMKLIEQNKTTLLLNLELIHWETLPQMLQSFQGKQFSDSLTKVAGSLSRHYGVEITLKSSMNVGAVLEALEESVSNEVTLDREAIKSESIYAKTPKENDVPLLPEAVQTEPDILQKDKVQESSSLNILGPAKIGRRHTIDIGFEKPASQYLKAKEISSFNLLGRIKKGRRQIIDMGFGKPALQHSKAKGVQAMLRNCECKHSGYLLHETKERLVWFKSKKSKWVLKYFIISKEYKEGCVWNLYCFVKDLSSKQEWSISMREVESILECNKGIVGIRIIYSDPETPELMLKIDTVKNRKIWLEMLKEAHAESQPLSADSGFGSGGSIPNRNSRHFDNQRDSEYMYSRVREINDDIKGTLKESERACTMELDDCKDDVLRRPAVKSGTEKLTKSENRNKVIIDNGKDMSDLLPNETCLKYDDGLRVFGTKDYKLSAKVEDTAATDECNRNTDMTCVKENLQSPIQETKCNRYFETQLATTVHSKHKINNAKTIVHAQSGQLTSTFRSDDYENFELGQDENTRPKVIDDNADFETLTDSDSSTFMSVAGCSDSFVSVGQSKLGLDSHFIGTSEGDKKSDHVMIKENTFKSLQVDKAPENEGHIPKHLSLPHNQEYYPPGPLSESSKEDPSFSVQGIKYQGAESSNDICSKHNEENTSVLPTDSGDVNFRQVSTSHSQQSKSAVTTETENTSQSLEPGSNIEDGNNAYENITFFENKEQNKVSVNENEMKRGSNSSTNSTSSSGSCTDSVTYESPDESAHYENMIFLREEEYFCEREEDVKRNLQDNPPGTFLICKSGSKQKLWFVTDNGRRFFKIHRHGEKLSLFKYPKPENIFLSLNQLLMFYHLNDLPSNSYELKLERAYKSAKKM
ncbi:uncharacterized protein LOC132730008 [Ruditapes philippinarum]|uniref:uncharacterized protein LOC132730008 n=1 Tax=Ruditapes philippinarum TaxID=129788 RepID=UPI00295BF918|nr:uncharacterized protein LOC132730008 [Ruditapes philippinarum]